MSELNSIVKPKEIIITATRTRKDGTIEDLGVVSYYHQNKIKNFFRGI